MIIIIIYREIQEKIKNNDYSFWIKPEEAFDRYLTVVYPLESILLLCYIYYIEIKKNDRGRKSISVFSDMYLF